MASIDGPDGRASYFGLGCRRVGRDSVGPTITMPAARRRTPRSHRRTKSRRPGRDGVVVDCRQDLLCGAILGPSLKDDVRSDGHGGHQVLGRCRPPHRFEGESGAGGQACVGSAPAGVADQPCPSSISPLFENSSIHRFVWSIAEARPTSKGSACGAASDCSGCREEASNRVRPSPNRVSQSAGALPA